MSHLVSNPTSPRVVRAQLHGPAPYGGVRATSNRREIAYFLRRGWNIRKIRLIPRDPARQAAMVQAEREAPILAEIQTWEAIEDAVTHHAPLKDLDRCIQAIHRQLGPLHGKLYDLRAAR
jgi:hypothetical protein